MKILKKLLIPSLVSLAILIAGQSQAMEKSEKDKFWYTNFREQMPLATVIEQHKISSEMEEVINKTLVSGNFKLIKDYIFELPTVPSIIIKGECCDEGAERVIGSLCINQCAAALNLDAVKAPIKLVYRDKNGKHCAVMEKVNQSQNLFSLKQMQQMYIISKRTGYIDIKGDNIVNTNKGIVYFIDTERSAFRQDDHTSFLLQQHGGIINIKLEVLNRLYWNLLSSYDEQAKQWLKQTIEKKESKIYPIESKS